MIRCPGADDSQHEIPLQAQMQRNGRKGTQFWSNLFDSQISHRQTDNVQDLDLRQKTSTMFNVGNSRGDRLTLIWV